MTTSWTSPRLQPPWRCSSIICSSRPTTTMLWLSVAAFSLLWTEMSWKWLSVGVAAQSALLDEGSPCTLRGGAGGVCRKTSDCPWAIRELNDGRRPSLCGYSGLFPVVCCPTRDGQAGSPAASQAGSQEGGQAGDDHPAVGDGSSIDGIIYPTTTSSSSSSSSSSPRSLAERKCAEYASFVFAEEESLVRHGTVRVDQCAVAKDSLIVGGIEAKPKEFPHMALIGYDEDNEASIRCGGSLISPDFVLTAAHCVYSGQQPALWVLLGALDLDRAMNATSPSPSVAAQRGLQHVQRIAVAERFAHPDFQPPVKYSDIALLRLASPAVLSGHVRPACLHTEPGLPASPLVATGWGATDWQGDASNRLMKVSLAAADDAECARAFAANSAMALPRGVLADSQLCAGRDGKDTCQGDSGGPLQVATRNDTRPGEPPEPYCMYRVVGLTSFGSVCGLTFGVYTRVRPFVPWIERTVWPRG